METIRIGLAGCGLFGESHLRAFRSIRNARVEAVFDVDGLRASRMAAEFAIPRICHSIEQLCALENLDAIDVVTPESAHLAPVLAAFRNGKHVFVEKPMAVDLDDCRQMMKAADESGRFLMPGHILRFETKYAMLRDEVMAGGLGKIISMHARRNRPKSLLTRYGRIHPAIENCIHDIDLMLWYANAAIRRVRGFARHATGGSNPDAFWGVLEFSNGAIGIVETIWLTPPSVGIMLDDAFRLVGDAGIASLALVPGALTLWRDPGPEIPDVCYDPRVANSARGALREGLDYVF
jgi:UDP-N-acetylglucosamine 3-dehydrogenase